MTINQLLELPVEEQAKLSDEQLTALLSPYFSAVRKVILPDDKPTKQGVSHILIMEHIAKNADAIRAFQTARKKQEGS